MDLRRLRTGEWLAAASAVVLLVTLFLPWYEAPGGGELSAWEAFAILDVVLVLVAVAALALWVLTTNQKAVAVPLALNALLAPIALVVLLFVLMRLANLPLDDGGRLLGAWLGTLAMLLLTVGTFVALRDERLSKDGKPTDVTGRPAPPPDIETLPAPSPSTTGT